MTTVAVLTTAVATHELYRLRGEYRIITTPPNQMASDLLKTEHGRKLTTDEAMEWIETVKRCGGLADERLVT